MKIELNLPALERLIGGDTEIEVALRRQIVEEFAKRHLKEVAEKATYSAALEATKLYVDAVAKEVFDVENLTVNHLWPTVGYRFKSMIETLVKELAQKYVDAELLKTIEYQKRYWSKEVRVAVENAVAKDIDKVVQEEVQRRLKAAAEIK